MKCIDFENRLNELLDDRLSPQEDAALIGHAENCVDCREMLAAQENLFLGMAALQRRTPWLDIGPRVLSELNTPVASINLPPPVRRPLRWLPLLASAAVVLIAVGVGFWIVGRNNRGSEVAQPGAKSQDKERHQGLSVIQPGGRRGQNIVPAPQVVPAPKSVPQSQAIVVAPAPTVEPRFVPPLAPPQPFSQHPDIDGAIATIASQWQSSSQWQVETINVEQYAPGIRPIRESFEVAIDALLKTIPQGKKEARPMPPQALQPYGDAVDLA